MSRLLTALTASQVDGQAGTKVMPVLAASVTDETTDDALAKAARLGLAIAEIRYDLFVKRHLDALYALNTKLKNYPMRRLLTIRAGFEGGEWAASENERLLAFQHILPALDALDIELAATDIRDELIAACRAHGVTSIVSHHDFNKTPSDYDLSCVVNNAIATGADVIKIAATVNDVSDLQRLARLLLAYPEQSLVIVGMGLWGITSRMFFPALGSAFTFVHIGQSTAAGQLDLAEMQALVNACYPGS